ncbi:MULTISPECIES: glycosyltransferase family 4 protein [Bacteroides]|jgi:glycosyltransferase involved in cell wall biosynthesis|uniref:glycosyltransferase family 4 protein n=1 Tax=Bacteroides TaxID=816 RepID=UPI00189CCF1C|nr:glycosyltransferase family 4 protein [Bacteroides nordii]
MDKVTKNKVLVYLPMIYPARVGGVEVYNYHLANNIQNFDVARQYVFCTSKESVKGHDNSFLVFSDKLFVLRRFGLGGISYFLNMLLSSRIRLRKVRSIYASYVSSTSTADIVLLLLLHYIFSIRIVLHIHGGGMKPWKPFWLHKLLFEKASAILGVSEKICEEYQRRSGKAVTLSLPIVPFKKSNKTKDVLKRELGLDQFQTVILYVGSIKELKSPRTLLDAFFSLPESWVKVHNTALVFCGDGPMRAQMEEDAKKHKYKDRILFMGNIGNEDVNKYYAVADKYVICSWFEGTPISLLQAYDNNVLSYGTNVNGINKVIKDKETGFLFEKDDSVTLARLLQEDNSVEDTCKIVTNAKHFYESKFSYKSAISGIVSVL